MEDKSMTDQICCVCGRPPARTIGLRWFCEEHFQSATHERTHTWRGFILLVVGLIAFVGLVYLLDSVIKPVLIGSNLLWAGVLLALVPAAIWMTFFYLQDQIEPEPKGYILAVFLLGALLAAAVGGPFLENVFRISHWLYASTAVTILGGILVLGFTQEFLKYAAVRYSVYLSTEFDEPTDGVIYATAAGLGYATILNIQFILSNGGVALGASVIRMAVVALAQASFAGITGYFLGRAKFEHKPLWWMPLGLTLAATANGLFNWLRLRVVQGGISLSGSSANPWMGLLLAAVVAILTTGIIFWLVRRNIRSALAEK
jgi:RsiW-degrading membrane proteinase PrsW (M82 family)